MHFRMHFRRFFVVLGGVQVMPMSDLGTMCGLFVISGLVVLGGLAMVLGRMLMVIRGLLVVFVDIVFVKTLAIHRSLPFCSVVEPEHCRASMKHSARARVSSRRPALPDSGLR